MINRNNLLSVLGVATYHAMQTGQVSDFLATVVSAVFFSAAARTAAKHLPTILPAMQETRKPVADLVDSALGFPEISSSAHTDSSNKDFCTSKTETLHLFDGTRELDLTALQEENLRNQFIIIETSLRATDAHLLDDLEDLEKQRKALDGAADRAPIEKEIKRLEKRLEIKLAVDFASGVVSYTNGDEEKVEASLQGNTKIQEAIKELVKIHGEVLKENLTNKVKEALEQDKEIKEKGKVVRVLSVDLERNKCTLNVDGEEKEIDIPKEHFPSAYSEVAERKNLYMQVALRSYSHHPLEILTARIKNSPLVQRLNASPNVTGSIRNLYTPPMSTHKTRQEIAATVENSHGRIHVERNEELNGSEIGPNFKCGLIHYISCLNALIKEKKLEEATTLKDVEKLKRSQFIFRGDLKGVSVSTDKRAGEIQTALLEKLQCIDLKSVEGRLDDANDPDGYKRKILQVLQDRPELKDKNPLVWPSKEKVKEFLDKITKTDGSMGSMTEEAFKGCKDDLFKEMQNINLKETLAKWEARKKSLGGDEGIALKANEARDFNKRNLDLYSKMNLLDATVRLGKRNAENVFYKETISGNPLFEHVLMRFNLFKQEANPFVEVFESIKKDLGSLSEKEIQDILDVCATLVEDEDGQKKFLILWKSLNTPFHTYHCPKLNFGFGTSYLGKNVSAVQAS